MDIKGSVALVSGANRGIGRAYLEALIARGAAKVYAGARQPERLADLAQRHASVLVPIKLDITQPADIASAAGQCRDVTLLVNNAGINLQAGLIAAKDLAAARAEMETNYFGPLAMCRAFAPILADKAAALDGRFTRARIDSMLTMAPPPLALTQGVRAELAKQGTLVVAVMPGAVDTEMERNFPPPKLPPADAARAALDGVEQGLEEVYPGDMASGMSQGLAGDPKAVEKDLAKYLPG